MASADPASLPRVFFLDSGVLLEGLLAPWSRAVLALSRRRVFKIILAQYVQGEVEENLLELLASDPRLGSQIIGDYSCCCACSILNSLHSQPNRKSTGIGI